MAMPVWPGDEDRAQAAGAGRPVELDRDGLLADRAVGADREHDGGGVGEILAGRHAQVVRRLAQVTDLDAVDARQLGELAVLAEELVHAGLEVEPGLERGTQERAPFGRQAAAGDGDADQRRGRSRLEGETLFDGGHDRNAFHRGAGVLGVDHGDDRMGPVENGPARRLPVVGVERLAFS
jgi:hypothetical protein